MKTEIVLKDIPSLSSCAMLVDFNASVWTARKLDKGVSAEVEQAKSAHGKVGAYTKDLSAGSQKLKDVANFVAAVRQQHYKLTLPWSDSGTRLLPMGGFFDYNKWIAEQEAQFWKLVEEVITEYQNMINTAAFKLGAMFNRSEYPSEMRIRSKFSFNRNYYPVPEVGDLRVNIAADTATELRSQYDAFYTQRLKDGLRKQWDDLYEVVSHIVERLTPDGSAGTTKSGEDRVKRFHETTLDAALEQVDLLAKMNVTNDPELEAARKALENALLGVTVQDIRKNEAVREDVKTRMQEIIDKFSI